jgi:hypothetical protein
MVGKRVRSEATQQLLSDLVWKLHNRVKPSSLTYVIQQIEIRKAHKTLRSAERAPTLSAGPYSISPTVSTHRGCVGSNPIPLTTAPRSCR